MKAKVSTTKGYCCVPLYFEDIGWVLLFRFHLRSTSALRTPCYYRHLDNTESNETPGNTIHLIGELLHFALIHYASERFYILR